MKEILEQLIQTFYDENLPQLMPRKISIPEHTRNATVITGMRRTGKTFLSFQRMRNLLESGISADRFLYLNFEDERLLELSVEHLRLIPDIYYKMFPEHHQQMCYFFFDEIQNVKHWELFVRRLVDTGNIQVYLTGSSAKMLTSEIATAMRGRSLETEVFPFSFEEFILYHKYYDEIPRFVSSSAAKSKIQNAMEKFFQIGGFPDIQDRNEVEREQMLQGYANATIYRDIVERYKANPQALKFILHYLFNHPAQKISIRSIAELLDKTDNSVNREYIRQYLDYFCDSYLLYKVPLHTDSFAKRRTNPDKYYFVDLGLMRAMTGKHSADNGHLLENQVFIHLRRKGYRIEYVITRDNFEIDFLAYDKIKKDYRLIQVSYNLNAPATLERETRALINAGNYFEAKEKIIVTWEEERELDNDIKIVPIWKFLLDRY